jgi:CheY-like chemotaxis protein
MGRPVILLVDDHADSLLVLSRLLEQRGYDVIAAHNGAAALRLAAEREFDVLVSDITLPDGPGTGLLGKLRAIKNFPAIAISGSAFESDQKKFREAGFQYTLVKPFHFEDLETNILACLTTLE